MQDIKLDEIAVPKERFGDRYEKLDDLAGSFAQFGQLQAIRVEEIPDKTEGKRYRLHYGFRRLCAARMLGWETIKAVVVEQMNEYDRRCVELEENVQRVDLKWAEKAQAIAILHELKSTDDPEWSPEHTAVLIGESRAQVYRQLAMAKEVENDPELANVSSLRGALEVIERRKHARVRDAYARIHRAATPNIRAEVLQGDARELIKTIEDESVAAVVTDPPFGIDLKLRSRGYLFNDSEEYADQMMQDMAHEFYRVLQPSCWAIIFYDIAKIITNRYMEKLAKVEFEEEALAQVVSRAAGLPHWLREAGFSYVSSVPCLWVKPDKAIGRSSPRLNLIHAYDAFVFAAKGDARASSGKRTNCFLYEVHSIAERTHEIQKPRELMFDIISTLGLRPGELVLDPFAGSGTTGLAALDHGLQFVGFEMDKEYAKSANAFLRTHDLKAEDLPPDEEESDPED